MRMFLLILALAGTAAVAQNQPPSQPNPPMVPTIRPPQGAASRAPRHEDLARERSLRTVEKAEDRVDAESKQKEAAQKLRRVAP